MHAVGRVDLQPLLPVFFYEFIHGGGAIAAFRPGILCQVDAHGYAGVTQRQVCGLVFFVVRIAQKHRRQPVKRQLAIGGWIVDTRALCSRFEAGMIGRVAMQRPRGAVDAQFGE